MKPDYAEIWKKSFRNENGAMRQYQDKKTARSYDASKTIWEDGYKRAAELPVCRTDTVLDIGSGPGVLSIPLACKAKHVTLLDSSEEMLVLAEQHRQELGLENVSYIRSGWEEADERILGKFDYVIASYSLGMLDLKASIEKMNAAARKEVYLYWFSGMTTWEKISYDLLPVLFGKRSEQKPKADIIYGILSQLGISAEVKPLRGTAFHKWFPDRAAAMEDLRKRLGIQTDQFDRVLEEYLEHSGIYNQDGAQWIYRDQTNYVRLSWKVNEIKQTEELESE